jgi:hypothetical protein
MASLFAHEEKAQSGGVPMERQYARRGNSTQRQLAVRKNEESGTAARNQSSQVSDQGPLGGEAMVRGGGFLSQDNARQIQVKCDKESSTSHCK